MHVVHPPPVAAWNQASPRLAPWALYESVSQSWYECSGSFAPHPHPWCRILFPFFYDERNHQVIVVQHLHTHDRLSLCVITPKHVFWVNISKNKKINNSKNLKNGSGIHYLCHHMSLLVVGACLDLHISLSLHRGSHRWQWSTTATMERSPLARD